MSDKPIPEAPAPEQGTAESLDTPAADQPGAATTTVAPGVDDGASPPVTEDGTKGSVGGSASVSATADTAAVTQVVDGTGSGTQSTAVLIKSAHSPSLLTMPPPLPPVPPRWQRVARPPGVLPAAALAGVVGATVIPLDRPGIGWLITGAAVTVALCVVDYRARSRATSAEPSSDSTPAATPTPTTTPPTPVPTAADDAAAPSHTAAATIREASPKTAASQTFSLGDRIWWAAAALLLLGVGAVRAAEWLFVLCVLAACVAGSLAVMGRRSARGIAHDMFAVPLASFGAVPWAFSGLRESRSVGTSSVRRYGISVVATAAVLVVFVPLLGGADATFAKLLNGLVPTVDGPATWQWIFLFAVVTTGVLGALYLLAGPPPRASDSARPRRLWSRSEWMLPVGALTVLFAVFVGAQFVALFGGDDYVQRTAGLTYAEYARSGFWQLSAVSVLTLAVILAVLRWSVQDTAADRRSLRVLLSAVSVLALVIVCSALGRMWTYQQAYGFTVLRLLVTTCELWVGLVYVLVLIAIARLRWGWVSRAAIGTALGTLIALALLDPEQLVAERNIDRWQTSGRLDADYLSGLSPDILPALEPLPAHVRTPIETSIRYDLDDDHWWSWNFSRSSAR
ncbi:DUF4153 domain-containing protein [Nocardia fluminea]|uniref:DUF4153 domain-containing protein n=1 Tax=Nocardia fluminea TaxID=134984 RepID=UPI00341E94A0